jgi:hypothetical protein
MGFKGNVPVRLIHNAPLAGHFGRVLLVDSEAGTSETIDNAKCGEPRPFYEGQERSLEQIWYLLQARVCQDSSVPAGSARIDESIRRYNTIKSNLVGIYTPDEPA